jgi:hypothetical protein
LIDAIVAMDTFANIAYEKHLFSRCSAIGLLERVLCGPKVTRGSNHYCTSTVVAIETGMDPNVMVSLCPREFDGVSDHNIHGIIEDETPIRLD